LALGLVRRWLLIGYFPSTYYFPPHTTHHAIVSRTRAMPTTRCNTTLTQPHWWQVHDFWHVLFGVNTSVLGEAALKVRLPRHPLA
jgi:hypothetical protein